MLFMVEDKTEKKDTLKEAVHEFETAKKIRAFAGELMLSEMHQFRYNFDFAPGIKSEALNENYYDFRLLIGDLTSRQLHLIKNASIKNNYSFTIKSTSISGMQIEFTKMEDFECPF